MKHRWLRIVAPLLCMLFAPTRSQGQAAPAERGPYARDQDKWVTSGHYDKRDPRRSLEQFRVLREGNLALLKALTPEQWKHCGIHSERGEESVEHMVRMLAGHDLNHLRQAEEIAARH